MVQDVARIITEHNHYMEPVEIPLILTDYIVVRGPYNHNDTLAVPNPNRLY